jgi:alpha-N-arabinofuranosidase
MYRLCRRVTMANLAQMVNALGMLHTTPDLLVKSPIYHVFDLYANHTGRIVLDTALVAEDAAAQETLSADIAVRVQGRPAPQPRIISGVPYVDAVATLAAPAEGLRVAVVNRHRDQTATLRLDLAPLGHAAEAALHVHQLSGADPMQQNTVEQPDAVVPASRRLERWPGSIELPPCSVTVMEWEGSTL